MQTLEVALNNKAYEITKLNAIEGFKLQVRVTKLLSSALGGVSLDSNLIQDFMKMEEVQLIKLLSSAIEKLDEQKFIDLVFDLVSSKNIKIIGDAEGQEVKIPLIASKLEIIEIYELFYHVLRLNLGGFLGDVQSKFKALLERKKKDSLT